MKILVNGEPLDFALEHEQSLGEVIDGLQRWLTDGAFTLTSLVVNGTTYPIHNRSAWDEMRLDDVETVSVEALRHDQADQTAILALEDYLAMLHSALEASDDAAIVDLANELPHVTDRLVRFFPSLVDENGTCTVLQSEALVNGEAPLDQDRQRLMREVSQLRGLLMSRAREYAHPVREMALTLGQLSAASSELEQVPVQLQTGKGAEAMKSVVTLTELLSRVYRLAPLVSGAKDSGGLDVGRITEFTRETSEVLSELQQAFEINDTVLVGDLLEYELAPRMRSVAKLVPEQDNT